MSRMLSLLLFVAIAAGAASGQNVECPQLVADEVCADAKEGFAFSDGCNQIRCLGNGLSAATRKSCSGPSTPEQQRQCRRTARKVFESLGPFSCANVEPERVCQNRGPGFRFSDGCNGLTCAADGSAVSTLRSCPDGDSEGAFCRFIEESIGDEDKESGSRKRRRRGEQEFTCPQLAASAICKASTNGLTYSDGCNTLRCHSDGTGQASTFKYCPAPEDSDAAGQAFCQQAEREARAKIASAKLRNRCLEEAQVCQGANLRQISYNDGCNACKCIAPRTASCTRRSCPKVLMTDEEFADYCKLRGTGKL